MNLAANPLVVAAALGLLGPAALMDDDAPNGDVAGIWTRSSDAHPSAADLGDSFELIPVDDQLMLDDGSGSAAMWTRLDDHAAEQELLVDGTTVRRTLRLDGDALSLEAHVTRNGTTDILRATYRREV